MARRDGKEAEDIKEPFFKEASSTINHKSIISLEV
jgi:hypothetical protein